MKLSRTLLAIALMAAALSLCGSADAANVIVGPSLAGIWASEECEVEVCLVVNDELGGTGTNVTSPVSGAVVGFSVVGGKTAGTYHLRTLVPGQTPVAAFFRKASAPVAVVPNAGIQSYPTLLPIAAGETVGLGQSETASVGFRESVGHFAEWETEPAEDKSALASFSGPGLVGFDYEVQPAPTVTSLATTSGPTGGGTSVTIAGTDFVNVTGVSFGSVAASSFSVQSEGQLTAVAPSRASAGAVSVTVTTIAGRANAPGNFTYEAPPVAVAPSPPLPPAYCVVPKITGKKLAAATTILVAAKCKLGTVTKRRGATPKSGRVVGQGVKAGTQLPVGAKVAVTLKPVLKHKPKRPKKR